MHRDANAALSVDALRHRGQAVADALHHLGQATVLWPAALISR
eukprot:CAMPEP_0171154998 /NCGR_PEP_ID=MMETSP0790-20130122/647_1 /TAXON_ID=2925 /ORGANISM="Alexandrium catenella, Strain OF101" /LENGTH=42 /DNA_ID= /DNA_START= /DNA_END= /DNA_ORIENTATION=